jgi:hypothetical protein
VNALLLAFLIPLSYGLVSCSSQKEATGTVNYVEGGNKRAIFRNGVAYAPKGAPKRVRLAIDAGNRLQNKPYKWGGGHARLDDSGYDCSGAVSYVLREAGLMQGQMPSREFFNYGKKGYGNWINVFVQDGHVFMTVAGLRLDTGGSSRRSGPRWKPVPRSAKGHVVRHPAGY